MQNRPQFVQTEVQILEEKLSSTDQNQKLPASKLGPVDPGNARLPRMTLPLASAPFHAIELDSKPLLLAETEAKAIKVNQIFALDESYFLFLTKSHAAGFSQLLSYFLVTSPLCFS
jgi:hypothetical protein